MRRSALLAVLFASLLVPGPEPARADATPGQRAYMEALRAYEVADYTGAAGKLRVALREDSSEGLRKFRLDSLHDEDYLPHLYLGLSLEKLGQPREALEALRESERQGAVRGRPGSQRILASALARLSAVTATPVPAVPTPAPPAPTSSPVAEPVAVEPPLPPSVPAAAAPRAQASPPAGPRATPHPAGALPAAASAAPADGGEALREGIRAFFRGEYGPAARRLEGLAAEVPTARAFLALSLAGSYVLGGSKDGGLLERARTEMRSARAAGVTLPQSNLLPPGLLTLLE